VYGLPGCGKTVLMKSVMSFIMTQSEHPSSSIIRKPIFFFFNDKDPARKTSDALVRSILDQILREPRCMFVFRYLGSLDTFQMTEDRLWDSLFNIVQSSRGIMFQLVIDAVDEALRHNSRPPTVIDRLQSLLAPDLSGRVRLLLSHRRRSPYEFYEVIRPAEINMDNNYMRQNVYEFVQRKVRGSFEETGPSRATVANTERAIIEKSHGNFLCATLAWGQFSHGTTD
jgi:ABC-type dipeptide/oligopeptide/nickel transport system ATPase component